MPAASPEDSGPLGGARILVTRPARQSAGLSRQLAVLGGKPVVFPAIAILPPDDPAPLRAAHARLDSYDFAVFVSANAVEFGVPDPRAWPESLIAFAPGHGTAEALYATGIHEVRFPAERQDSEGLLALSELADVRGKRVLIFRGDGGREQLADTLRGRGATVDYVTCYRRARPQSGEGLAQLLTTGALDAVTITSSEGLDNLWSLLVDQARTCWARLPTFVPHARIEAHARELSLRTVLTGPGDSGLIAALLEWVAANPHGR